MDRQWCVVTKQFGGDGDRIDEIRGAKVRWLHSDDGPVMRELPGSDFRVKVDLALLAMGFEPVVDGDLAAGLGLATDADGRIVSRDGATSSPDVFVAGDLATGPAYVASAIASGRAAAEKIDAYLAKTPPRPSSGSAATKPQSQSESAIGSHAQGIATALVRRCGKITAILKAEYPQAATRLHHANPLQLLVATILAAQCTDDRVNLVTQDLFARYRSAADFAAASQRNWSSRSAPRASSATRPRTSAPPAIASSGPSAARCPTRWTTCSPCPASPARRPTSSWATPSARTKASWSTRTSFACPAGWASPGTPTR